MTADYQSNQQKIVAFLTKHKDKAVAVFGEYKNEQNKVNMNDYLLIMRQVLAIDPNMQVYENRADVEPYLEKVNCLKSVTTAAKRYFFDYLGLSPAVYPAVSSIDVGYEVYWEFFDYLIKSMPNFYLEYNLGGEADNLFKLRREIEGTRDKYVQKLSGCQSELEENIINGKLESRSYTEEARAAVGRTRAQDQRPN